MSNRKRITTRYTDGIAQVAIGSRTLNITQRTMIDRHYFCPVELISAALGS